MPTEFHPKGAVGACRRLESMSSTGDFSYGRTETMTLWMIEDLEP
jgi:hypothetical protein